MMKSINISSGGTVVIYDGNVVVNGEPLPKVPNIDRRVTHVYSNGGCVCINGYEYVHRKKAWKRTLKAIFHDWL